MQKTFQICQLSDDFYTDYPNADFPEILKKPKRAYYCLSIRLNENTLICIPFRSEISHQYAFLFRKSQRSQAHSSGIDYTKSVIITDLRYIKGAAVVDRDEFKETILNQKRIEKEARAFVDDYIMHTSGQHLLPMPEYRRRYQYSPLKYFHKELGL